MSAQSSPARRVRLEAGHIAAPRVEALRWVAGLYFLIHGASFLLLPQGSVGLWLGAIWLRGAVTVATGLILLWVAGTGPPRRLAVALHILATLPQLVVALEYWRLGSIAPTATLGLFSIAILLAPLAPPAKPTDGHRPEALALVLGLTQAIQGFDFLVHPEAVAGLASLPLSLLVFGVVFLLSGLAVVIVQFIPKAPRGWPWLVYLVSGGALLAFWIVLSTWVDPAYWVLNAAAVLRGVATILMPWLGPWAAFFDARALRSRLAIAFVTAALVPTLIVLPIVLNAVDNTATQRALRAQQSAAIAGSAAVAEEISRHRTTLATLAAGPELLSLPTDEQAALLDSVRAADPRLVSLAVYDGEGKVSARSGAASEISDGLGQVVTQPQHSPNGDVFGAAIEEGRPVLALARTLPAGDGAPPRGLVGVAELPPLDDLLTQGAAERGTAMYVIDVTGVVRATSDATVTVGTDWADQPALQVVVNGPGPDAQVIGGPRGPRIVAYAPIPATRWQLVTLLAVSVIQAGILGARQVAFGATLLAGLCAALAGGWFASQFAGPISALVSGVGHIAGGEHGVKLPRQGATELVVLTDAVETMAATLEARAAEREGLIGQLRAQNEELRALQAEREEYVRAISHDLRNPLAAIHGHAQLLHRLLTRQGRQQEARSAEAIMRLDTHMNNMIRDLVDALRLGAGAVQLRPRPVDLPPFIADACERIGGPTLERRIHLVMPDEAVAVQADPTALERILANLVSNALKYSPDGSPVTITLSAQAETATVAVADEGQGMTVEEQSHLFTRYYRAPSARAGTTGLGLGLYITQALVQAQGGSIWVESRPGKGSTFRFTLPRIAG